MDLSRRSLLGAGLSAGTLALAALMSGCTASEPKTGPPPGPGSSGRTLPGIDDFLAQDTFAIAHRGSGDNWPEHTLTAYRNAIAAGAQAVEISVHASRDKVLLCHHDTNLLRMTGVDRELKQLSAAELAELRVDARAWLGPGTALEPIPTLKDVLDSIWGTAIVFIEDKSGENGQQILELLDGYPDAGQRVVWKQTASSDSHSLARERGYKIWGYFLNNQDGAFERYQNRFDVLGIYHGASDDDMKTLVGYGKPVICWEIHRRSTRERVSALGIAGLMCSNFPYVMATPDTQNKLALMPPTSANPVPAGTRPAGDLPWKLVPGQQPVLDPDTGAAVFRMQNRSSYQLGSLGAGNSSTFTLSFALCWPELAEKSGHDGVGQHPLGAGVAFGAVSDDPLLVSGSQASCFYLQLRADGRLALFERNSGGGEGAVAERELISLQSPALSAGEWARVSLTVAQDQLTLSREDKTKQRTQGRFGGTEAGYLSLVKGYTGTSPVAFRELSVR